MNKRADTPTILLALSVVVSWGFSFIAIEIGLRHAGPGQLVTLRFLPALLLYALIALPLLRGRAGARPRGRDWLGLALGGLFGVLIYNFSLNTGQTKIPASLASLVIGLNPAAIALVAAFVLGERPPLRTWAGLLLGLVGIVLVVVGRHGAPELRVQHLLGVAITLGAPISWGFYNSIIRRYAQRFGALRTTALAVMLGSLPLLLTVNGELVQTTRAGGTELAAAFLFLGVVCTVYGFTAWAVVLKRFEAARAGAFIYLVPLIATVGSHFLLGEPIDLPLLAGGSLVLAGVAVATGRLRLPRQKASFEPDPLEGDPPE